MAERTLRIGIVGGGAIVRNRHMPGLQALPDVEVVAVCNRRRASAERFAAEYQVPAIYDDWRELVSDPEIDIVVIGTWRDIEDWRKWESSEERKLLEANMAPLLSRPPRVRVCTDLGEQQPGEA